MFRFFINLDSLLFIAHIFTELHRIPKVIGIENLNLKFYKIQMAYIKKANLEKKKAAKLTEA